MYVHVLLWVYVYHMYACAGEGKYGPRCPRSGVTGSCQPSDEDARNQTQVLCEGKGTLSTAEPSPQPSQTFLKFFSLDKYYFKILK